MAVKQDSEDPFQSAHTLIKALKGAANSVQPLGVSKIQIARQAWAAQSLYLPNKADFLRDWIIDTWTRAEPETILDPSYHELIALVCPQATPLDNPPYTLLSTYFKRAQDSIGVDDPVHGHAARSLRLICSGSAQPLKVEAWLQLLSSLVGYLASPAPQSSASSSQNGEHWMELWDLVLKEWKVELNPEAQRKLAQSVLSILQAYSRATFNHPQLRQESTSFTRVLLPIPSLQQREYLDIVFQQLNPADESSISIIPILLRDFISFLTHDRYVIFSQSSSSKNSIDVSIAETTRAAIRTATSQALAFLSASSCSRASILSARQLVWREIGLWGGYLETDVDWANLLRVERSFVGISLGGEDEDGTHLLALRTLQQLAELDHDESRLDSEMIGWCLTAPAQLHQAAEGVLLTLIKYHNLTQSMSALITLLDDAYSTLISACQSKQALRALYGLLIEGPLFSSAIRSALQKSPIAPQHVQALSELIQNENGHGETDRAKRRKSSGGFKSTSVAALLGVRSRLILLVAGKHVNSRTLLEQMLASLTEAQEQDGREPDAEVKSKKGRWSYSVLLSSQLRLTTALRLQGSEGLDEKLLSTPSKGDAPDEVILETVLYFTQKILIYRSGRGSVELSVIGRFVDYLMEILEQAKQPLLEKLWDVLASRSVSAISSIASVLQLEKLRILVNRQIESQSPAQQACHRILASAEMLESPLLTDVSQYPALVSVVLPNQTRQEQETQFRTLFSNKATNPQEGDLEWVTRLLFNESNESASIILDEATALHVIKFTLALLPASSPQFTELWKALVSNLCLRPKQHSSTLHQLLQNLASERLVVREKAVEASPKMRAKLDALDIVAQSHSGESYSDDVQSYLASSKSDLLETLRPLLTEANWSGMELVAKHTVLSAWLTFLRLRKCLKSGESLPSSSVFLVQHDVGSSGSGSDHLLPLTLEALQLEGQSLAGSKLLALGLRQSIPLPLIIHMMVEANLVDYAATLQVAIQALSVFSTSDGGVEGEQSRTEACINIIEAIMMVPKEGSGPYVRQGLLELAQALALHIRHWKYGTIANTVQIFRQISEKRPYAIGPPEAALILEVLLQITLSYSTIGHSPTIFDDSVSTVINLLRHPHHEKIIDISLIVAFIVSTFPQFARRRSAASARPRAQLSPSGLGVEQAGTLCRLLNTLADTKTSNSSSSSSLAKHIPPILVSFVRVAAGPRDGPLPDIRRELRNGLFGLCDILTAGGRVDARGREGEGLGEAFGLGSGPGGEAERDVWADLWREWSRKRYTGQG